MKETQSPSQTNSTSTRPIGLILDPPSTGISRTETFTTVWVEEKNKVYFRIFAGYEKENPNQGVILIVYENPISITRVKVPGDTGSLIIESSEGDILKIKAKNGKQFKFDKKALKLLDAVSGENVLEVTTTPIPAYPYPQS